ncbi:DinB family protein [Cytobacillus praedii]|uniref:DinB family protein n=1 Tax=Cytobacillus praedii TaxID=1742358 RepID=UPI002E1A8F5C|nr:DinB family protein [Cytobacillus praedii]
MDYRIRQRDGFQGKIGELVSMLEYSREVLLNDIKDLDQTDIDFIPFKDANSIGSLLMHIASIDFVHQVITFEKRDLNENEYSRWESALFLGEKARDEIKNRPLNYYLDILFETRERTLTLLSSKNEEWLYEENIWDNGVSHNNFWLWYHVMEDEINHRGQIRLIKRMLLNSK